MAKRVRIFFINCPTIDIDAASFLILAQNEVQSAIQFELHHFWLYDRNHRAKLSGLEGKFLSLREDRFHFRVKRLERMYRRSHDLRAVPEFASTLSKKTWSKAAKKAIKEYDDYLTSSGYTMHDYHRDDPVIIITETALSGGYISYGDSTCAVHSTHRWKDYFYPASGIEFILTAVQRNAVRLCYQSKVGSHYPTRGCLWDFHVHQPDAKISSFLGFLCEVCREGLKNQVSTSEYEEIKTLLTNKWIGSESDAASVAGLLKKNYNYSLTRSTGLRPGLLTPIYESVKSELGKFLVEVVKWVLIVIISFIFLTYFPELTEKWRQLFNGESKTEQVAPVALEEH